MKHTINLTQKKLNNIISESIKSVLREEDENSYYGDGDFRHDYRIASRGYVNKSVNMPDHRVKDSYLGDCDSNKMHKDLENTYKKEKKNMSASDKRWQKAADSRPLHRKGSLNRAFDESIERAVNESFNMFLRSGI